MDADVVGDAVKPALCGISIFFSYIYFILPKPHAQLDEILQRFKVMECNILNDFK